MSRNVRWRKWFVKYMQNKATKHFVNENHEIQIIIYVNCTDFADCITLQQKYFILGFTHILLSSLFYVMLHLCLLMKAVTSCVY
jgi:hypothetical protein